MSWAWMIPAAVAAVGVVATSVMAWRTAQEAAGLRQELEGVAALQPALITVRDEMAATAVAVRRMQRGR
jgi:hypothetical protein